MSSSSSSNGSPSHKRFRGYESEESSEHESEGVPQNVEDIELESSEHESEGELQNVENIEDVEDVEEDEEFEFPDYLHQHYENIGNDLATAQVQINNNDLISLYVMGEQHYALWQELGSGTFATVFRGVLADTLPDVDNEQFVAIKVSKPGDDEDEAAVVREVSVIDILMVSPHQNVIDFREYFTNDDETAYFIISELADNDLYNVLMKTNENEEEIWQRLKPQYCRHLIRGIAEGVAHLHSLGIAHGDIKIENILICQRVITEEDLVANPWALDWPNRVMYMTPKLTDFNSSERGEPGEPINREQPRCTITTAAPESWFSDIPYDMIKADVYSVGAVLLSLLLSCSPFRAPVHITEDNQMDDKYTTLMKKDRDFITQLVRSFDYKLKQVLLKTLEPDPQKRITIQEFLGDEWFTQQLKPQECEEEWESTLRKNWEELPHLHLHRKRSL